MITRKSINMTVTSWCETQVMMSSTQMMTMVKNRIRMAKKMMTMVRKDDDSNEENGDKKDDDTEDDQDDSHIMVCDRDTTDKESLERKNLLNAPHTMDIAVIIVIIIPVITIELCFS